MLERRREFAQLLAFDVPIDREAQELADETGVKIFKADIIYHLFDQFNVSVYFVVKLEVFLFYTQGEFCTFADFKYYFRHI